MRIDWEEIRPFLQFPRNSLMTWDAKLGLLVGAGIVLAVALIWFRPEGKTKAANPETPPARTQMQAPRTVQLAPLPYAAEIEEK
jgi:hypothetical protein